MPSRQRGQLAQAMESGARVVESPPFPASTAPTGTVRNREGNVSEDEDEDDDNDRCPLA
jgi:hypothetical protein